MTTKTTLSIIGPGKVGTTIATLANRTQQYDVMLGARDPVKAQGLTKLMGGDIAVVDVHTAASHGDIVLLTVTDDAISPVCTALSQAKGFKAGAVVAHCSGALSSDELVSAREHCHTHIASMHPLQTFPNLESALDRLAGSYCYYEGDADARATINQLITRIEMLPIEIQKESKSLYHASAVVACNYFSALMDASLELGEAAGIDRKTLWQSLEPLVSNTLENIKNNGPEKALTGPIARGDNKTIDQHLNAINSLPSIEQAKRLNKVYCAMGIQSVSLAEKKGSITAVIKNDLNNKFKKKR
jgi:predicted short-subunit dehydrogenase-like oxidoreductase (DUF2520 family)